MEPAVPRKPNNSNNPAELRRHAEARLRVTARAVDPHAEQAGGVGRHGGAGRERQVVGGALRLEHTVAGVGQRVRGLGAPPGACSDRNERG